MINNAAGSNGQGDSPVAQWIMNEARSKMQETMQKLGLDAQRINGKHLSNYSVEELG